MENRWQHGDYQIIDGLKPGGGPFQYFFIVSRGGERKCRLCVWITDDALAGFEAADDFAPIISSARETWMNWVKGKLDAGDLRDRVLKFDSSGEKEFDLSAMSEKLKMD